MKTKEQARANLEASIAYIPDRFRQGVSTADWLTKAGSDQAEANYADAVSRAIAAKKRQLEVRKVTNADWQTATITKGAAVIGTRIREALDKQASTWGPIYDRVVSDIARLPARTADFRSNVTNRVLGTVESWKRNSGNL